jgi:A/G-specific adenine glycosylase
VDLESARLGFLRRALKDWGRGNLRRFPWRGTRDPYRILIAELMLRRTRPGQVAPVYKSFLRRYPSRAKLATAREAQLYRLLAPLGLRWRARNVVAVAKALGRLPRSAFDDPGSLRALPGVGEYVSRAVQVMAFNRPEMVIDTNVIRVLGRYWGFRVHPEARRQRRFRELALRCVPRSDAKLYTLALLDLGASICTPPRPHCNRCPLRLHCSFALRESLISANSGSDRADPRDRVSENTR